MAYTIDYADSGAKNPITVEDNTINTETSLKLPGKNSLGYGQVIAEDLVRLLENFASPLEPANPVEGQLWYDNVNGQLKIYDGTQFTSAGGLQKAAAIPAVADSVTGDLWVDKEKQQLYLFSGTEWILVGPQFSEGLTTGVNVEQLVGTDDNTYNIIKMEVNASTVAIIAFDTFTPKLFINGFAGQTIKPGFNLASRDTDNDNANNVKYFGVAEKAESLIVSDKVVSASNFLRGDTESTSSSPLNIQNADGIKLGANRELSISMSSTTGVIRHNNAGGNIEIKTKDGGTTNTVLSVGSNKKVGINTTVPDTELEVVGDVKASGTLEITDTTASSTFGTGSIIAKGGVGVALDINVGGGATFKEAIEIGNLDLATAPDTHTRTENLPSDVIVPDLDNSRNIGNSIKRWKNVYASKFVGNLEGTVSGSVSGNAGTATRLATSTTFQITGDVETVSQEFNGVGGTKQFDLTVAPTFITSKTQATNSLASDLILIDRTDGIDTGLRKVTKQTLFENIPGISPVGGMMIWPGATEPTGWKFCNAQELDISIYAALFAILGYTYNPTPSTGKFALPDLRGRFPLGLYNMGSTTPASTDNRITDTAASTLGAVAGDKDTTIGVSNLPEHEHDMRSETGQQFYAFRETKEASLPSGVLSGDFEIGSTTSEKIPTSGGVSSTSLGEALDVTNPYLAMNYIIYTGVN